ncbi:protein of unknown function [Pustulibacterium marinum]|uniref:DUF4270 domain-containing protein n=1 Tax=Pustulibacterium marinum TaxID=1224947 RepID=A0A1I7HFC6_9FLAO|nr:DUF4270 domain-containing protein [Pustulibacterium marinum]SFU59312.1 protein of unknown function [Pustulibacterium marinum]
MFKNSKRFFFTIAAGVMVIMMATSCEKEFSNLDLAGVTPNFEAERAFYPVHARNVKLNAVQTNGLDVYQLGKYNNPIFGEEESYIVSQVQLGTVSPTFGTYSQAVEMADDTLSSTIDEHETITRVYLDIPYFSSTATDDDGAAILDDDDVATYTLDSIYGNQEQEFTLRVDELTYYLGDYDPDSNFTEGAKYFSSSSDLDFQNYLGENLVNDTDFQISSETIKIMQVDDETTEEDESEEIDEVLEPRLRLDFPIGDDVTSNFFQTKILDMEDATALENNNNFKEYFRGIVISTSNISDNLLMLLSLSEAKIVIEYEYRRYDADEEEGYSIEESSFELSLAGNIIQRTNSSNFPSFDTSTDPEALYVKGGQGSMVELSMFDNNFDLDQDDITTPEAVSMMQSENWLINEANLTFSINHDLLDQNGDVVEPSRLYLFSLDDDSAPVIDYAFDGTTNESNPYFSKYVYGGIVEKDDDGNSERYKIRLTEHLNTLVQSDSTNVRLGIVVTSNVNTTTVLTAKTSTEDDKLIPSASVTNPFGTILYGTSETVPEDKRLRLEVYYTNPINN